jgi:hypothetical protein
MSYRVIEQINKRLVYASLPKRHRDILRALLYVRESKLQCGHLQEVIASTTSATRNSTLVFRNGAEDAELGVKVFANIHDRRNIAAAVAVVRSGPDGDDGLLGKVVLDVVSSCL